MVQRRKKVSHAKEAFYVICILILLLIGLFSFVGPGGYLELRRAQAELEIHRSRVETLQKSNVERMNSIRALREDDKAIEGLAREKGYGKKGEVVQEAPQSEQEKPPTPEVRRPASDTKPQKAASGIR
jgi:cell division protein FtsB